MKIRDTVRERISSVVVGGMTFDSYNPERDQNGSIGIALADVAYQACKDLELEERADQQERLQRYANFVSRSSNYGGSVVSMKRLLIECFPGRFGENGTQPIRGYDSNKTYGLYKRMSVESKRILRESR